MDFVKLSYEGRNLKMRQSQLTIMNIGKAFKLIPDSLLLVYETGTVALPDVDGLFDEEVDSSIKWRVDGEEVASGQGSASTTGLGLSSNATVCSFYSSKTPGVSQWKPRSFPPIASKKKLQRDVSSWIKSIELCTLKGSNPVILTEYPISLDDSTANVEYIQEKLSSEAFNGEKVKLMNVKNIAIADTEATRGLKYWKTSKTVKAMSQNLYNRFRGVQQGTEPGPSRQLSVVAENYTLQTQSPVHISDSESDTVVTVRKKRRYNIPSPPSECESITGESMTSRKLNEIITKLDNLKDMNAADDKQPPYQQLVDIFTCLICADVITDLSEPVVPPCCRNVVYCRVCLDHWLSTDAVCPHCRAPLLSIGCCQTQPIICPLFDLLRFH